MARDPLTKLFSYTAGVPVTENAILDSGDYNSALQEVVGDFNRPLDIEMGGTGANSLETALTNLGGASSFYLDQLLTGFCAWFLRPTPPDGWLIADGREVSRSQYSRLYNRIGSYVGGGNGTSTFNLPDLRGQFIRGADMGRGIDAGRLIGSTQADENKSHDHDGQTVPAGAHVHATDRYALVTGPVPPITLIIADFYSGTVTSYSQSSAGGGTTGAAGAHPHDIVIHPRGTENRPKNVALLGCVKA